MTPVLVSLTCWLLKKKKKKKKGKMSGYACGNQSRDDGNSTKCLLVTGH